MPPRSVNPVYGPGQKRLKQYAIPSKNIADAFINHRLSGRASSGVNGDVSFWWGSETF